MTVVFSSATSALITVTVDSAVTQTSGTRSQYDYDGRKVYSLQGLGCVATWGARQGNKIGQYLKENEIRLKGTSIVELAESVFDYLRCNYEPHKDDLEDVGYHIAGFDQDGAPHLYHAFWGVDRPPPQNAHQGYKIYNHSPIAENPMPLLYNGRNDLVNAVLNALGHEIRQGKDIRFDLTTEDDRVRFADFIIRFASEITPEVGPPFYTCLISPENCIEMVRNDSMNPININTVRETLAKLKK